MRYLESEFPESKIVAENPEKLLRTIGNSITSISEPEWKSMRAYFAAQKWQVLDNKLEVQGFLKGSGLLSADSLVHISGFGDYEIEALDIGQGYFPCSSKGLLDFENHPDAFVAEQTWPTEDELANSFAKL